MSHRKALGGSVMGIDDVVVDAFMGNMWGQLRANQAKGGWGCKSRPFLMRELRNHLRRLQMARKHRNQEAIYHEAVDVANFAMMIGTGHSQFGYTKVLGEDGGNLT